jgi:hypothetical protein
MAAGDELGGAIGLGEVVDRPDHADADRRPRPALAVEAVVGMDRLRRLAGFERNGVAGREQEVGLQERADQRH